MREMARMAIESGLQKLRKRSHQFELFGIDYMFDQNLTVEYPTCPAFRLAGQPVPVSCSEDDQLIRGLMNA
jgi:hypothetical protein